MVGLAKSLRNGIFGAIESAAQSRLFDGAHPRDPAVTKMFGMGTSTHAGVRVNHDTVMAIPAMYRGINIISNALARVPFYVFKQDEEEGRTYATGHTSWKAVAIDPHPETKMVDFRRIMTSWAIGWGNAVAHIHRPGWPNGGKVELTPLLPDRTIPFRITEQMVKKYDISEDLQGLLYYQTRIGGQEVSYPASDCLHIRGLGSNPYWGYDIVELLVQALGGAQARAEFGYRFYGQGANPAGFITIPTGLDEEAEERFSASIKRGMEGMGKSHRIMLLEEGATFNQWTVDPEKAQFIEGLQFDYRVLANILGIKVHKLIDGANSSYNSLEQANSEHRDDDLFPWIMQWKGEYNKKMLTERQQNEMTHVIDIDDEYIDGWVPFADRVKGVVDLKNNDMITRDEGRSRLNWGPSKDRNGKRFTMPMNIEFTDDKVSLSDLAKIKSSSPEPRKLPAPADDPDDDDSPDEDERGIAPPVAADATTVDQHVWQYDCRKGDFGDVYLDGEQVPFAIACDCAAGRVLVGESIDGNKVIGKNADGQQEWQKTVRTGHVVFVPRAVADRYKASVEEANAEVARLAQLQADGDAAAKAIFERLSNAWIDKIKARLGKQASKLAAKPDPSEFIAWIDSLSTESAPGELQAAVDDAYRTIKQRLLLLVDQPSTDHTTGLAAAVAAEVASWSSQKADDTL